MILVFSRFADFTRWKIQQPVVCNVFCDIL